MQLGKESVAGTSVAATRAWYPDGSGMIDIDRMRTMHEDRNPGTRANISHATQMGVLVKLPYRSATNTGVSFDELQVYGSQVIGGKTSSGAAADKTWGTYAPNQTSANNQETFTIEVGDDTQEFEVEYCNASAWRLSAARGGNTQGEIDWFGRQSTKSTKTSLTANNAVKIPAYLWKIRFATAQSGLAGASDVSNFLRSFDFEYITGLEPAFYLDGNAYFGQAQESKNIAGTLRMVVDSNSQAITQFYDKAAADTVDFIQLKATGPALGNSNYSCTMQMAVLYEDPKIISGEIGGVNTYEVVAHLAIDATWAQVFSMVVVNSGPAL
jgi:hypothetical protein